MSKIHNTVFNNLAGDAPIGNETQLVVNGTMNSRKYNNILFLLESSLNYLSLSQFELALATYQRIDCASNLTINQTIFFGSDTVEFISYLESLFGFSDKVIGVTNKQQFNITYLSASGLPPVQTIIFSSNSPTYNYLKFNPGGGNPISNNFQILNGTNVDTIYITATYSSGVLQSIEFSL